MAMPFSDEDLKPAVAHVLTKVEPMLALDGGSIAFLDVINGVVFVQLQGACVGCASSGNTLKYGVERRLKEEIHQELSVINVPFGMEQRLTELL
jgi:Fe-S cluster biogenesis protein NfuA